LIARELGMEKLDELLTMKNDKDKKELLKNLGDWWKKEKI
jgi:hypothetical protein